MEKSKSKKNQLLWMMHKKTYNQLIKMLKILNQNNKNKTKIIKSSQIMTMTLIKRENKHKNKKNTKKIMMKNKKTMMLMTKRMMSSNFRLEMIQNLLMSHQFQLSMLILLELIILSTKLAFMKLERYTSQSLKILLLQSKLSQINQGL